MTVTGNQSTRIELDGEEHLYFGGTNYLGLSHRGELMRAASEAFQRYGFSAGASRLTSGENDLIIRLEERLAAFLQSEAALVLSAGFMANQAVVDGLDDLVDVWVVERHAHGSIKSALSQSSKRIVVHDSPLAGQTLREKYRLSPLLTLAVFAESVDPLSGELTDVGELSGSLGEDDYLILDEAHSLGVLGGRGAGSADYFRLESGPDRLILSGTFSKALGSYGGFVTGSSAVISAIKSRSNCFKVSTSLSPRACAATLEALRLIEEEPQTTVEALQYNIERLNLRLLEVCNSREGARSYRDNPVPIYYLPNTDWVARLRDDLLARRIYIPTVTSYFADFCEIGLRWTIQAGHSPEQIDRLAAAIESFAEDQ